MQKVLVTGGAGFIGSHLAEELAARGYHVLILDNLSTGKLENISGLLGKDNVELCRGSVTNLSLLKKLTDGVTYVFHEAAVVSVPYTIEDPQSTNDVNVTGTLNVLIAARDNNVKKVVFASSCAVYGDRYVLPQSEAAPLNPLSPYAVTKVAGECYCHAFSKVYNLPTVSLRYFNVYGLRQDAKSRYAAVIPIFAEMIARGLSPVIFGDGEQSRDFTFVKDVVSANILAAESNAEGGYNIGSSTNITINKLAGTICRLMGKNLTPVYDKPRAGDLEHSLADITRAASFGYKPEWDMEAGLEKIIAGY